MREALQAPGVLDAMDEVEAIEMLLPSTGFAAIGMLLMLVSVALFFIVGMKNTLGMQFYLAGAAGGEGKKLTMKSAYAKTKGRVPILFRNAALLGLVFCGCLVPMILIVGFLVMSNHMGQDVMNWVLFPAMIVIFLLFLPRAFLITPVSAFEEKQDATLSLCARLTKGNFLPVAVIAFVGVGINVLFGNLLRLLGIHTLIRSGISSVISLFIGGFTVALAFVTYQTLKPKPEPAETVGNDVHIVPLIEESPAEEENTQA